MCSGHPRESGDADFTESSRRAKSPPFPMRSPRPHPEEPAARQRRRASRRMRAATALAPCSGHPRDSGDPVLTELETWVKRAPSKITTFGFRFSNGEQGVRDFADMLSGSRRDGGAASRSGIHRRVNRRRNPPYANAADYVALVCSVYYRYWPKLGMSSGRRIARRIDL